MAILSNGDMSIEVRFSDYSEERWCGYDVVYQYRGESIFRDDLLKRSPKGWAARGTGALRMIEFLEDALIGVVEEALTATEPVTYTPSEPDMTWAFLPRPVGIDDFGAAHSLLPWLLPKRYDWSRGISYYDPVLVVCAVDAYNWHHAGYSRDGILLTCQTERAALRRFRDDLADEYADFKKAFRVDEKINRDTGEE